MLFKLLVKHGATFLSLVVLSLIMLSVIMLSESMLSVIMMNARPVVKMADIQTGRQIGKQTN